MIHDLDSTLAELIRRELPPELVAPQAMTPVTISFATPDEQFPPSAVTLPAIDLFLYDIRENRELRGNGWLMERQSNGTVTRKPPARVDCSYLITAWPSDSTPNPAQDEHRLLGEVMQVLLRHTTLPAEVLQGSLHGQEPPMRASVLQTGYLQSVGEFWQALGGKPKAALQVQHVTISVDVYTPLVLGPAVTDTRLRLRQRT